MYCLCFLKCCLGWSQLFLQGARIFSFHGCSHYLQWFWSPKKVCHCFHCFPIYLSWSDETGCNFLLSFFTFIKRLFRSSSLSAIRVVSSTYLRLLIFLLAILIPACASSSLVFHMMYSAHKLNKQGDGIQPWCTSVCCSMSNSNCCFLTCIQISQKAGQVVWYSHLFQNFPRFIVIHTVKGFGIVNKAEIDVFLELSCSFWWPSGCWQFDLWFFWLF